MSISANFQARDSLTEAQRNFLHEKRIRGELSTEEWMQLFNGLLNYDFHAAAARQFFGSMAALAAVFGLISLLVGMGAQSLIALLLSVVFGICFGVCLNFFLGFRRLKFADNFREFILPAVSILREDVAPDAQLEIQIDLRGPTHPEKQVNRLESHGGYPKTVETSFIDAWMTGKASLVDGTVLRWEIADHVRQRKTTKRNPRGKTKIKTKYRIKRLIKISLGLRQSDYTPALLAKARDGMSLDLKKGEKRNVLRAHRLIMLPELNAVLALDPFISLIGGAYQQVALNPTGEK